MEQCTDQYTIKGSQGLAFVLVAIVAVFVYILLQVTHGPASVRTVHE